ncbi:MAG: hypothetical protein ACK4TF_06840 [Thermodesulfovibrionales bacterium]
MECDKNRNMKPVAKGRVMFLFYFLAVSVFLIANPIYAKEISYTQEDRDRLIRLEEGQKAINQRIDDLGKRIDDLGKRIDDLRDLVYVVLGGIIALIGFVIWDRRTALAPTIRKYKELEEREERIEKVLKELARQDPKIAEILRQIGII